VTIAACTALLAAGTTSPSLADSAPPKSAVNGWAAQTKPTPKPVAIPAKDRSAILGKDYTSTPDAAFTTSGDATGFHLLVADAKNGYAWRTAATLSEPGTGADSWIGNACVTASGKRAAVAYAPRTFTNRPELMARGAFTAVVDLTTGKVTKLPFTASLAYFSPGCGQSENAVFTQLSYEGDTKQQTRLVTVDTATGKQAAAPVVRPGEVTSAIPVKDGIAAAHANRLVRIRDGKEAALTTTRSVAFQLTEDTDGGVTFIDRAQDKRSGAKTASWAKHLTGTALHAGKKTSAATVASGRLTDWDLTSSADGQVFVTGRAKSEGTPPERFHNPGGLAKGARLSQHGRVALNTAWADGKTSLVGKDEKSSVRTARVTLHALATGKQTALDAIPGRSRLGGAKSAAQGAAPSPALAVAPGVRDNSPTKANTPKLVSGTSTQMTRTQALAASPTGPSEGADERYCAVSRNDVKKQAFQPTPRQVEWAVDQAVVGSLRLNRPANWKNTGMDSYSPQGLFPPVVLAGDPNGTLDNEDPAVTDRWHIPSQVMLGVTAQESNMWQATHFAVPGVTANSLIGNYYGTQYTADGTQADPWRINFSKADCGYGITQATDGMRLAGKTKTGETALPPNTQDAVALDYATNVAYGVQILSHKWNDTYYAGMKINGGNPQWIENWFFALWAYNSGFYNTPDSAGHMGLGWTNNPANPLWKANRVPFLQNATNPSLDDYSHAAHPQDWPYEEKVLGWAARPISAMFGVNDFRPGYLAAWWNTVDQRTAVKPPIDLFCDSSNSCDPSKISNTDSNDPGQGACTLDSGDSDTNPHWLHCWWGKSAQWKDCDKQAACGHQVHRFNTSYPEQADASSYPPKCTSGLDSGALIVDDIPAGTTPAGSDSRGCGAAKSDGTFTLNYEPSDIIDADTGQTITTYPGKIDTHQIGAGFGNHFWFTHTRSPESYPPPGDRMKVTGTWTLGRKITEYGGQAKVYAFVPDHGAQTGAANYKITTQWGTETKTISQKDNQSNKWVDLGNYRFGDAVPKVTLDNFNGGDGSADIAYDAIAFVPGNYSGIPDNGTFPAPDDTAPDPADYTTPQSIDEAFFTPGGGSPLAAKSAANTTATATANTTATVSGGDTEACSVTEKSITYNRTSACAYDDIKISSYDSADGTYIGSATFSVRLSVHPDPNSATIQEEANVRLLSMTSGIQTAKFIFDAKCRGYCSVSTPQWAGSDTWTSGDTHTSTYTRNLTWDQSGTTGIKGDITPYWETNASLNGSAVTDNAVTEKSALIVRCDTKAKTTPGCVFGWYKPTYVMNTKKWSAAAAHAWLMQNKLPSHFGLKGQGEPLKYLGDDVMSPSDPTKTQRDVNRSTICGRTVDNFTPYLPQNGPGTALQSASDSVSCDEIAFAASYQSGGTPTSIGGTNPVKKNGNECVQTFVGKRADGSWYIDLRADFPNPTWREGCGRSSMSGRQNSGSMSAFGGAYGFSNKNRLLDGDEYWLDLNGFTL
jgi:hypothetical protein